MARKLWIQRKSCVVVLIVSIILLITFMAEYYEFKVIDITNNSIYMLPAIIITNNYTATDKQISSSTHLPTKMPSNLSNPTSKPSIAPTKSPSSIIHDLEQNEEESDSIYNNFKIWYNEWIKNNQDIVLSDKSILINSGTPNGVSNSFDCSIRFFAWNYGKFIQPQHGENKHLYDALQLSLCNIPIDTKNIFPVKTISEEFTKKENEAENMKDCVYYIDPFNGNDDGNNGGKESPFYSIIRGIDETRKYKFKHGFDIECIIFLMEGTFYLNQTILLTKQDSYLQIKNYPNNKKRSVISGGIKLEFATKWKLIDFKENEWRNYSDTNNIDLSRFNDLSKGDKTLIILGTFKTYNMCLESVIKYNLNYNTVILHSFTWFDYRFRRKELWFKCIGIRDISWGPRSDLNAYSGHFEGRNIYSIKIKNNLKSINNKITGLRLNGKRLIRARFPNHNPSISMQFDYLSGWIPNVGARISDKRAKYVGSTTNKSFYQSKYIILSAEDYKDVEWPMSVEPMTNIKRKSRWRKQGNGEGGWGEFVMGINGPCYGYDPPFGYWCAMDPPRAKSPVIMQHKYPQGVKIIGDGINITTNNDDYDDGIIHVWHPNHWFTWMFDIKSYNSTHIMFNNGGMQGAEGDVFGAEYYIENVLKELDAPNEYFYDIDNQILYIYHNQSVNENDDDEYIATNLKVLFRMNDTRNITFSGLIFKDTHYTFMDIHGFPSSGDWALTKKAAIILENTENILILNNIFTNLDGHAIFLLDYNRNTRIKYNKFSWIGESCICLWGSTITVKTENGTLYKGGPDGRNGKQPRNTIIEYNQFREIGIFQKQSSAIFQAVSCLSIIKYNIIFNGPRSGINFNDGFGGNNKIFGNLLLNTCRESGDHGPFNAWDRLPYITKIRNGTSSIIPGLNLIYNNMFIGTYQVQEAIDTDDGVCFYNITDNFFIYGDYALKGDFAGHDIYHIQNVYAYIKESWFFCCAAGANDILAKNQLIFLKNDGYKSDCNLPIGSNLNMPIYENHVYLKNKTQDTLYVCMDNMEKKIKRHFRKDHKQMTFKEWQQKGNDVGTVIYHKLPSDLQIVKMGIDKLFNDN